MKSKVTGREMQRRISDEDLARIGENMRRMMSVRGMSQFDITDATGIGQPIISRYVNGRSDMRVGNMLAVCGALRCTPNELLDGAFDRHSTDECADG